MPQSTDLMGLGLPPQISAQLGNQAAVHTCTGTTNATAVLIKTHMPELVAASSQTGAIFNSAALVGSPYFVFCSSSTAAVVYPPVGKTMNGTTDLGVTVAQNKMCVFIQFAVGKWCSNLTA